MENTNRYGLIPIKYSYQVDRSSTPNRLQSGISKVEYRFLIDSLAPFFDFNSLAALGKVNRAWRKVVHLDGKKCPWMSETSLLLARFVQQKLFHSKKTPISMSVLHQLSCIETLFNVCIYFSSYVHHLCLKGEDRPIKDLGLSSLAAFSALRTLQIEDDWQPLSFMLSYPSQLTARHFVLESLRIRNMYKIQASHLNQLNMLPVLKSLEFENCTLVDAGEISRLTNLQDLKIQNCAVITDDHLTQWVTLTALKGLTLVGFLTITSEGIRALSHLDGLRALTLKKFIPIDVGALTCLTLLNSLSLSGCCWVDNEYLRQFQILPLRHLNLTACPHVNYIGLSYLSKITTLEDLNFSANTMLDEEISEIAKILSLRTLNIVGCKNAHGFLDGEDHLLSLERLIAPRRLHVYYGRTVLAEYEDQDAAEHRELNTPKPNVSGAVDESELLNEQSGKRRRVRWG